MFSLRSHTGWGKVALVALVATAASGAAGAQESTATRKSVYGKLETVDAKLNGVIVRSDAGERLAWRFDAKVIAQLVDFKRGDPVVVIYRQTSPSQKAVTAIAFPGKAGTPIYVNATGSRITMRSAPMVDGTCGGPDTGPVTKSTVPIDGTTEVLEACWCCADSGDTCAPSNKTGDGLAVLVRCFK